VLDYPWSSLPGYASVRHQPEWLSVERGLGSFEWTARAADRRAYPFFQTPFSTFSRPLFPAFFPEIAASLGEQKARAVIDTGADVVASGNIGCLTQLRIHLARLGSPIRVRHTFQILRDALAD
ncbi:MAG: (Fe-S)-binding protein, partial [Chthoniobacteraceae bacterium]